MLTLVPAPAKVDSPTTAEMWVFSDPRKCNACGHKRQTLECCSCQEHYCRRCLHQTKPKHDKAMPVCGDCYDESVSYARYGVWGPP